MKTWKDKLALIGIGLVAVAILVAGAWAWGSVKASTYNSATGKNINWYEALILDPKLRD